MGFITFRGRANLVFNFANCHYYDKKVLLEKIASEPIELRFKTRIDLALAVARDKLFTNEAGDRSYIPDVLIVSTDGKHEGSNKSFDFKAFVDNINKTFKVGDSVSYVAVYKS